MIEGVFGAGMVRVLAPVGMPGVRLPVEATGVARPAVNEGVTRPLTEGRDGVFRAFARVMDVEGVIRPE